MVTYAAPRLDGHKILYKSRRYWIFEIDEDHPYTEHPYEGFEKYYEVVVYDKFEHCPAAFCSKDLRGDLNLGTFQDNIGVSGDDFRSLIVDVQTKLKDFQRLMRC